MVFDRVTIAIQNMCASGKMQRSETVNNNGSGVGGGYSAFPERKIADRAYSRYGVGRSIRGGGPSRFNALGESRTSNLSLG